MIIFNILLLEDNEGATQEYKNVLKVDEKLRSKYKLLCATNVCKAKEIVRTNQIHAAILDLQVPNYPGDEDTAPNGIEYLYSLIKEKRFPLIIMSANLSALDEDYMSSLGHIKRLGRVPGVHGKVFEYFDEIESVLQITPVMDKIVREIEVDIKDLIWELWKNWKNSNFQFNSEKETQGDTFLKRYLCSHLIETWMAKDDDLSKMHHAEFYVDPPIRDRIHTGDILELGKGKGKGFWMVITAPCDLSNGDKKIPKNLTLLECKQINDKPSTSETAGKLFTKPDVSKHYLPPWKKDAKPHHVLFKNIKTMPFPKGKRDDIKDKRVASLSMHFLPYLLQRYGAYVSRIGQANIDADAYHDHLERLFKRTSS